MADKNWQAGGKILIPAQAVVCVVATVAPFGAASAASSNFAPQSYVGSVDPGMIWQMLIGGIVIASFLAAIALWVHSALRKVKRAQLRRNAFVSSALNNLSQGVVMTDAQKRIVFCNDRYLEIYGLTRSDVPKNMTGPELLEMRRQRGLLDLSDEEFRARAATPEGLVTELPDGRSVVARQFPLPNGGTVATHEDCSEQRKLSRQLASTKQFLESVLDNVPVCVAAKSIDDGRYIFANRAFERFSRFSRDNIVGKRADEIFRPETTASIEAADQAALSSPDGQFRNEFVVERGSQKRVLSSVRVVARDDRNRPEFLIALFDDVTDRRSLSEELENTKKFLELVVDNIPVSLIVERVSDGRYLLANRSAETILNRRREDATGLTAADIFNPREAKLIIARDEAAIKKRGLLTEEHPISTKDGLRLFLTRRMTVLDDAGEPQYLIKTHEDVTDRRQTELRMAHMAYHDGLTDLPNRAAFLQALAQMIEACEGTDEEFAVLSVDLDGLKEINDVFGHAVGDKLLIEVAHRIQHSARGGVVARLSGDEFGMIIDGKQPVAGVLLAEQLAEALSSEFLIDGKSVRTGCTTGISVFPHNGSDAASLLANAGAALFRAKAKSRGSISIYEPEMDQQIRDRRVLHQDLSLAIRNGELSLHYQPQAMAHPTVAGSQDHRLRGAGAVDASGARLRSAERLHPARRRERPDRRDGRMDPARGVPRGGVVADAAADRGQPVAGAVHARRRGRARALDPARNRPGAGPARAGNHRGRADRGFRSRPGAAAAAEGARRAHFDGRLRQRLFLAELSAGVSVRQDQDRPRLRHQSRTQSAVGVDRARRHRPRPRPRNVDRRRGRGNPGAARLPRGRGLRRGAGLFPRQAAADRAIRRAGRPQP